MVDYGMYINNLDIKVSLGVSETNADMEDVEYAINKLKFWLDESLDSSIVLNGTDEASIKLSAATANNLIFCPGVPNDSLLAMTLYSKVIKIAGPDISILEFKLSNNIDNSEVTFMSTEVLKGLPEDVSYCGLPCFETDPWWRRTDGFTYDYLSSPGKTFEEMYSECSDLLDHFDSIYEAEQEYSNDDLETQEIIKVQTWTPKVI
jgi:hypothetical protein